MFYLKVLSCKSRITIPTLILMDSFLNFMSGKTLNIHDSFVNAHSLFDDEECVKSVRFIWRVFLLLRDVKRDGNYTDNFLSIVRFLEPYLKDQHLSNAMFLSQKYAREFFKIMDNYFDSLKNEPVFAGQSVSSFNEVMTHWRALRSSPHSKLLNKACLYLLSFPVCSYLGLTFDGQTFERMSARATKVKFSSRGEDFYFTLFSVAEWLITRGYQAFVSKDISILYMDKTECLDWSQKVTDLIAKEILLPTCEDHGFTPEMYMSEVLSVVDDGKRLLSIMKSSSFEATHIQKQIRDLEMIRCRISAAISSSRYRDVPFSILLNGPPGIGKSSVLAEVVKFYAKYTRKSFDPNVNMYTKNFSDKYWTNYDTNRHWCVVLDDLANESEKIMQSTKENSVLELIQIVNTVGYVTNQADISDKGNKPFRSEFVVGTTNVKHLNAYLAAATPAAVLRRMPYVITPIVKSEYRKADNSPSMARLNQYEPDAWLFRVEEVIVIQHPNHVSTAYRTILDDASSFEFYKWLGESIDSHKSSVLAMKSMWLNDHDLCDHFVPIYSCSECRSDEVVEFEAQSAVEIITTWFIAYVYFVGLASYVTKFRDKLSYYFTIWFLRISWQYYVFRGRPQDFFYWQARIGYKRFDWYVKHSISRAWDERYKIAALSSLILGLKLVRNVYNAYSMTSQGDTNFWYKSERRLPDLSKPSLTSTFNDVVTKFYDNVIRIEVHCEERSTKDRVHALVLKGNFSVTVRHSFVGDGPWRITFVEEFGTKGVSRKGEQILHRENCYVKDDLIFFNLAVQPKRDITRFCTSKSFDLCHPGSLLTRKPDCSKNQIDLNKIDTISTSYRVKGTIFKIYQVVDGALYTGNTVAGDCGAPLFIDVAGKPIFFGIHVAGYQGMVKNSLSIHLTLDIISSAEAHLLEPMFFAYGDPQAIFDMNKMNLKPIHPKSPLLHVSVEGCADIIGSLDGFRSRPKTRTYPTKICKDVERIFTTKLEFLGPLMKGYLNENNEWIDPWVFNAREAVKPVIVDSLHLSKAYNGYIRDVYHLFSKISPLSLEQAINGIPGSVFINRVPLNTSVGYPFNKPKRDFVVCVDEDNHIYEMNEEILNMYKRFVACYRKNERAYPIFMAHLKDEARALSKIAKGSTRVFTGCQFAFTVLVRQYFLPIASVLQHHPIISELMIGTNPFSEDWGKFYNHLTSFGNDRIVAGDYSKFDKKMPAYVIRYAVQILIDCAVRAGYTNADVQIMDGIATDLSFPIINFHGDLVSFYGGNPSGHPLTTIVNSLANSLYLRMAYIFLGHDVLNFKMHVALLTYGDDNIMGVSPKLLNFNHSTLANYFESIGMRYTMADKESESVPFIDISDAEILKRSFQYNDSIQRWMAPLDEKSILKSLLIQTRSAVVSEQEQIAGAIECAKIEFLNYGEEYHDKMVKKLNDVLDLHSNIREYLSNNFDLSWRDHITNMIGGSFESQSEMLDIFPVDVGIYGLTGLYNNVKNNFVAISNERSGACPVSVEENRESDIRNSSELSGNGSAQNNTQNQKTTSVVITTQNDSCPTHEFCSCVKACFLAQSDPQVDKGVNDQCDKQENVTFKAGTEEHIVDYEPQVDITVDQGAMDDADLGDFLSRPFRIANATWAVGGDLAMAVDVWEEFFRHFVVANKIKYFKLLRCDMHVRILINGTPFHVGKALAAWDPMNQCNPSTVIGGTRQHITRSQLPRLFIDAGLSQGGCMCLPYFWPNAYVNIVDDDFTKVGNLTIQSFAPLASCNGSTDPVTVTVFAWATNVKLCVPTTDFQGQSDRVKYKAPSKSKRKPKGKKTAMTKSKKDEYNDEGPVSTIATAVASASGALVNVPVIGMFARATSIASTAVGDIAKLFGFSRPAQLDAVSFMKLTPLGPLAVAEGKDPVFKLTVDPKQELSVDPRTTGLSGEDELSISYIAGKESYFAQATWDVADSENTYLCSWNVHPLVISDLGTQALTLPAAGDRITPTALHYLSRCFGNWSGSLIFRIQVVSSPMQRGRLAVIFDPNFNPTSLFELYNTTYNQIIDLDAGRDFEFEVAYVQERAYQDCRNNEKNVSFVNDGTIVRNAAWDNGVIHVRVLNRLVSPDGVTGVKLNIFVRAGPDFELMNPRGDRISYMSPFEGQSETVSTFKDNHLESENAPQYAPVINLTEQVDYEPTDFKPQVFFGERISSVRQLMKRYSRLMEVNFVGQTPGVNVYSRINKTVLFNLAPYYGYQTNGLHYLSDDVTKFNFVSTSIHQYFRACYAGWRGSVRYKVGVFAGAQKGYLSVNRKIYNTTNAFIQDDTDYVSTTEGPSALSEKHMKMFGNSTSGQAITEFGVMPVIEFEIPFASPYRFAEGKGQLDYISHANQTYAMDRNQFEVTYMSNDKDEFNSITYFYTAAGDDFTCFFWVGAPTFYIWDDLPSPSTTK